MAAGKIDIQLSKYNFSPGESIEGKVILRLNKAVKARGLNIRLTGEKKVSQLGAQKGVSSHTKKGFFFDFTQPLDGQKDYPASEASYDFQIKIPQNVLTQPDFGAGIIGTLAKTSQILSGVNTNIKWYLVANLDVPWKFDVSKKVQINIA